jgi:hypothetical protein
MLYLCTTCRYQTVNKKCYFLHLQLHEENSKQEEEEEEEEEEEDKKTSIKPAIPKYTCSLCDYRTNKKPLLKAHEKTHSNTYAWKCPQCNYKAYQEYNLKRHVKSIHENLRYHCDLCSYTTTRTNYLKAHIKVFHNNPTKSQTVFQIQKNARL